MSQNRGYTDQATRNGQGSRWVYRRLSLALALMLAGASPSAAEISVTDIAGREVRIKAPAKRILLEGPAYYPALSLLSHDASDLVVGVGATAARGQYEAERDLAGKPRLGLMTSNTFSVEAALALKPDLMIATLDSKGQHAAVEAAFATAGVPIVYVDFFVDPAANTIPSIEIIGEAIGEEDKAVRFAELYRDRIDRITERLEAADPVPPDLMIYRRSWDGTCCWTFAGGFISAFFDTLRVNNIAEDKLPGMFGQLSLETVIESDPQVFVATDLSLGPGALFGPEATRAQTIAALEALGSEPGLQDLSAIRNRRVHAIDQTLMRSPLNVLAIELFAKWIHPEVFADIDPKETLDEINSRFLVTPLTGLFWVSLDPVNGGTAGERP